jgi:hypothetical protein
MSTEMKTFTGGVCCAAAGAAETIVANVRSAGRAFIAAVRARVFADRRPREARAVTKRLGFGRPAATSCDAMTKIRSYSPRSDRIGSTADARLAGM